MIEAKGPLSLSVVIVGDEIPKPQGMQKLHGSDPSMGGGTLFVHIVELCILFADHHLQQPLSELTRETVVAYGKIDKVRIGSMWIETCRFDPKIFSESLQQRIGQKTVTALSFMKADTPLSVKSFEREKLFEFVDIAADCAFADMKTLRDLPH